MKQKPGPKAIGGVKDKTILIPVTAIEKEFYEYLADYLDKSTADTFRSTVKNKYAQVYNEWMEKNGNA